jgi:hypothetical protein
MIRHKGNKAMLTVIADALWVSLRRNRRAEPPNLWADRFVPRQLRDGEPPRFNPARDLHW